VSSRRQLLKGVILAPLAFLAEASVLRATDYASAAEALDAADRLEADVAARLRVLSRGEPGAVPFAESVLADHARHRARRSWVRRRLKLPPAAPSVEILSPDAGLDALRTAQQELVYAHAEGLPTLNDAQSVDVMARNMVDLSRHLTVIDLWMEAANTHD
jgi:hypothetical protein